MQTGSGGRFWEGREEAIMRRRRADTSGDRRAARVMGTFGVLLVLSACAAAAVLAVVDVSWGFRRLVLTGVLGGFAVGAFVSLLAWDRARNAGAVEREERLRSERRA